MKNSIRFILLALPSLIALVFVVSIQSQVLFAADNCLLDPETEKCVDEIAPDTAGSKQTEAPTGIKKSAQGGDTGKLSNPLQSQSIEEFILKIIDVLLVFATPIIMLYIMYAGYLFVTARGDSGQISTARSALLWAVVGGVIVLGARVIIAVIQGTIKAF